jgi:hypothetical protein
MINLLKKVLDWRGLDGDGISDPLRSEIVIALSAKSCEGCVRHEEGCTIIECVRHRKAEDYYTPKE